MSPTEFCRYRVIRSKSNFTVAFALLNDEKRQAMEALYAYCREIDDIGDSGLETTKKKIWLRTMHKPCYGNQ